MPQSLNALVERARDALGTEAQPIGSETGEAGRFTLFHAANVDRCRPMTPSLCDASH